MREIKKLDVKTPRDIKLPPAAPPKLEKVKIPEQPKLDVSTSLWDELRALFRFTLRNKVRDASEGKNVSLPSVGSIAGIFASPWKWIAILVGIAVLVIFLAKS